MQHYLLNYQFPARGKTEEPSVFAVCSRFVQWSVITPISLVDYWLESEAYNPEASNFLLCVKNHARVFLAGAAVQSEARKVILPKYGIREFKAKNFELATLTNVISTAERNRFVA